MNDARTAQLADAVEAAWGIIANVSGSDWSKQTAEWKAAAIRWRDTALPLLTHPTTGIAP